MDLSLAPTPAVAIPLRTSWKSALSIRAHRERQRLALLNDQVKKGGVIASSYVGGLSGAFIPVSEDQGMIEAVEAGALTLESWRR